MRSKKHAIITTFFSGLFLYEGEFFPALALAVISGYLFYKWWNHPLRVLENEIQKDAQTFKISVPTSYPLHMEMIKFYSKYLRLSTQFPALKETYKELVQSMWLTLANEKSAKDWKETIRKTDKSWPVPIDVKNLLSQKLAKVTKETKYLEDAMVKTY